MFQIKILYLSVTDSKSFAEIFDDYLQQLHYIGYHHIYPKMLLQLQDVYNYYVPMYL